MRLQFPPVLTALVTSFGMRSIQSLGGVIINAAIARHLRPDEFGAYFISLAVASLLATFVLTGANTVILRISASYESAVAFKSMLKILSSMGLTSLFVYSLYLSNYGSSLFVMLGLSVPDYIKYAVVVLSIAVVLQSLLHDYYRGLGKLSIASTIANYGALGSIGYGVISITIFSISLYLLRIVGFTVTLQQVVWAGSIIGIVVVTVTMIAEGLRIRRIPTSSPIMPVPPRRKGERVGLLMTSLLAIVLNQMDLYTVSSHFSKSDVGLYGAAQRLSLLVLLPLMIITAFFQPLSAKLFSSGETNALSSISRAFTSVLLLLGLLSLLLFIVAGKPIMGIVYGAGYAGAASILILKSTGSVALLGTGLANAVFTTTGNERVLVITGLLGTILFIGATTIWTPSSMEQIAALHAGVLTLMSALYAVYSRRVMSIDISPSLQPSFVWKTLRHTFSHGANIRLSVENK